jgi:hypothetical protein
MKNPDARKHTEGLRLEAYASAKHLPVDFLKKLGLTDFCLQGTAALRIPYFNEDREEAALRFRLSMDKKFERFRWRNGSKPCPYGLWKLNMAREAGHVALVEGESDCHALWFHKIPALGIPGANSWKEEWAGYFEGINTIYVVVEPDQGGAKLLAWVGKSAISNRVRIVRLERAKDPSALYLRKPKRFLKRWNQAIANSRPWREIEAEQKREKVAVHWKECSEIASEENILDRFAEALKQRGAAGISRIAKIVFLALMSRFLGRIVSIGLKGPSSGGKSFLLESVLAFFPRDAYYELTAMSDKALAYSEECLSHRFVVLCEASALESEWADYFIRSLLSEGRITYETVEKTPEGMRARRIEKPGPTGLLTTTTAVSLHPENETRYLSLRVNDSPKQTKRIIEAEALKVSGRTEDSSKADEALCQWHSLQFWLAGVEHRAVIPFATEVAALIHPVAVRLRRDFPAVMSLVQAHAILHQVNRERDDCGRIIAKLEDDYDTVRELVKGVIAEAAEQTVPKGVRETVKAVETILKSEQRGAEPGATIKEIAQKLGIDRSAAQRRVREGIERGFLATPHESRRGRITRVCTGDPMPEDRVLLPSAKEIGKLWKQAAKPRSVSTTIKRTRKQDDQAA